MKQPPIDLMPDAIRVRSQAGVVLGRYLMAPLLAVAVLLAPATHARIALRNATESRDDARKQAEDAVSSDESAKEIQARLDANNDFIRRYRLVAMPFEVSRLMATIVNDLTASASLDRIDLHVTTLRRRGAPRRANSEAASPRFLNGELVGFAMTDGEAYDIVAKLNALGICDNAKVEYTRQRIVRSRKAREFRISFRIDLSTAVEVVERDDQGVEWMGHVE